MHAEKLQVCFILPVTVGPGRARRSLGKVSMVLGSDGSRIEGSKYRR